MSYKGQALIDLLDDLFEGVEGLTESERDIAILLTAGWSGAEAARFFDVTRQTIHGYKTTAIRKIAKHYDEEIDNLTAFVLVRMKEGRTP